MPADFSRREVLLSLGTAAAALGAPAEPPAVERVFVERNDRAVESQLRNQITDPSSPWLGGVPDDYRMHHAGSAGGLIETLTAAFVSPQSKFHKDGALLERIRLAAGFLERAQTPEGNIDLLSTNFNSPPDTGFVVHNVGTAASIAKRYGADEIVAALRTFLERAGAGMSTGGIHTPNHRWVVSSALAQINEVYPNPAYLKRIQQWLAEGIDIDEDGQYTERSTVTYNTVCDRAFVVLAAKLNRPELLEPVRKNLQAMLYLRHPDGEVVTEVSRRQDQFTRGTMAGYWFTVHYLAAHRRDGQLSALASELTPEHGRLSAFLEYPELAAPLPPSQPLPTDYEKQFPLMQLARIRRGDRDATVVLQDSSRFLSLRHGAVTINAIRFATSFFGKGQFAADSGVKGDGGYLLQQSLDAPYYQPLDPPQRVTPANWGSLRDRRRKTQICRLSQTATVTETPSGWRLRIQSQGTPGVPLAVEISFREGGTLEGCRPAPHAADSWLLEKDYGVYRVGSDQIRFGPGAAPHWSTQLRGAEPKLPGVSVYLTGYTPFDHTLTLE